MSARSIILLILGTACGPGTEAEAGAGGDGGPVADAPGADAPGADAADEADASARDARPPRRDAGPPAGDGCLAIAAAAIEPGAVADFPLGAMPTEMSFPPLNEDDPEDDPARSGQGSMMQWQVRFHRDADDGVVFLMGKRNNPSATYLFTFDLVTCTWTQPTDRVTGRDYFWPADGGHTYDGKTYDFVNDCIWYHRHNRASALERWDIATSTFTTTTITPSMNDLDLGGGHTGSALAFHPTLFGAGSPGVVYCGNGYILALDVSDPAAPAATRISGPTLFDPYPGGHQIAFYSPARDAVFCGGGNESDALYRVDGGVNPTTTPVGTAPIPIRGANSNAAGVWELSGTLYAIGDTRLATSTDGGETWSSPAPLPAELSTMIANLRYGSQWVAASSEPEGVFWLLAHDGISKLWRP